jgi:hypothetical protein
MEKGQGQVLHDGATNLLAQISGASWNGSGQVGTNSLSFNGSSNTVTAGEALSVDRDEFAVSVFARFRNFESSSDNTLISQYGGVDSNQFYLIYQDVSNSSLRFAVKESDGTFIDANYADSNLSLDTWHHICGTVSDGTLYLYVDGEQVDSASWDTTVSGNDNLTIGARSDGLRNHEGSIDDARVYSRPLSQPEIEALYNLGQPSGFLVEEQDVPSIDDSGALARYEFENDVICRWCLWAGEGLRGRQQ